MAGRRRRTTSSRMPERGRNEPFVRSVGCSLVERATISVYEDRAAEWRQRRTPTMLPEARALAARCEPGALRADLGCGPGSYLGALGRPLVALDAAHAMLVLARGDAPDVPGVQADLEAIPFRRHSLGGA